MTQWLAGTTAYGAICEGLDRDAALALVDAELEASRSEADRARLLGVRQNLVSWRGEDQAEIARERESWKGSVSHPDAAAWSIIFTANAVLISGRPADAIDSYRRAIPMTAQNAAEARLGLILSAHLAHDLDVAREALREAEAEAYLGRHTDALQELARAVVAALDGRPEDALVHCRSAVGVPRMRRPVPGCPGTARRADADAARAVDGRLGGRGP